MQRLWSPAPFTATLPGREQRLLDRIARQLEREAPAGRWPQDLARVRAGLLSDPDSDEALSAAFVLVARACHAVLGLLPYHSQMVGAVLIHAGFIAEMATGEGKTLTVMMAAAVRALAGNSVHVVTVNDYLAQRDGDLARPLLDALGLGCGVIVNGLAPDLREAAYRSAVLYCSNKELVFDFLRARLTQGRRPEGLLRHVRQITQPAGSTQEPVRYQFAIVDEADSVLLDEALTPLVIAASNQDTIFTPPVTQAVLAVARQLQAGVDFHLDSHRSRVSLTAAGTRQLCQRLQLHEWGLEMDRIKIELVGKALHALHLLERDMAYIVREGTVQIVDEGTGRILDDRSWEDGLHQMVEAKEGVELTAPRQSMERISFQEFFTRYHTVAGATGTAREVAGELQEHYRLRVVAVPLHRPSRRETWPPRLFADQQRQFAAVVDRVMQLRAQGRPVLVGTRTVSESEQLALHLRQAGIDFALLNARNAASEASVVAQAGQVGRVTVATNMAGRGTDIHLAPEVVERGGLHVILTELHDARRIDRQLAGRCARQGDPGSFEMILRLDEASSVSPVLDRWILRCGAGGWPADGRGSWPALVLQCKRWAQMLRQREHAAMRRRLVAAELSGQGVTDF